MPKLILPTQFYQKHKESITAKSGYFTKFQALIVIMSVLSFFGLLLSNNTIITTAMSNTYYVSTVGNDSNDGLSLNTAFQSISQCLWIIQAGETCLVDDGQYFESDLDTQRSGTQGKPITIKAINKQKAVIIAAAPSPAWTGFGINGTPTKNKQYIVIDGFEVQQANYGGMSARYADHITFINNLSHNNGGSGIGAAQSDYITIKNNITHNNAFLSPYGESGIGLYQNRSSDDLPGFHNVISQNLSYSNKNKVPATLGNDPSNEIFDGNGIIIDDFRNTQNNEDDGFHTPYRYETLVENNIVFDNGGRGIHSFLSDNVTIRNNTIVGNNTFLSSSGDGDLSNVWSSNNKLYNNLIITKPTKQNNFAITNTSYNKQNDNLNNIFKNNLAFITDNLNSSLVGFDTSQNSLAVIGDFNFLGINPLLKNAFSVSGNATDFSPLPNSPAIAAADPANSPNIDFFGSIRSNKPTIGAIEINQQNSNSSSNLVTAIVTEIQKYDKIYQIISIFLHVAKI